MPFPSADYANLPAGHPANADVHKARSDGIRLQSSSLGPQQGLAHMREGIRRKPRAYVTITAKGEYVGTKDQRTSRLNMRLTPTELGTIREAAATSQMSVSAFMLTAALEKAGASRPASST